MNTEAQATMQLRQSLELFILHQQAVGALFNNNHKLLSTPPQFRINMIISVADKDLIHGDYLHSNHDAPCTFAEYWNFFIDEIRNHKYEYEYDTCIVMIHVIEFLQACSM